MKLRFTFSFFILLLITSCIKKPATPATEPEVIENVPLTEGLPENTTSINGYCYFTDATNSSSRAFACFSDPRKNLISSFNHINNFETLRLGNISVGRVTCAGAMLQQVQNGINSLTYSGFPSTGINPTVIWSIEGNGPFKGFSVNLLRGTPEINEISFPYEVYRSKGLVLDLAKLVPEYDSVVVILGQNSFPVRKVAVPPQTLIVFTSTEITNAFPFQSFCQLNLDAFNYSHCTVNNKNYIFECGNSTSRSLQLYD